MTGQLIRRLGLSGLVALPAERGKKAKETGVRAAFDRRAAVPKLSVQKKTNRLRFHSEAQAGILSTAWNTRSC